MGNRACGAIMSIQEIFAANLRRMTENRGSINFVARQLKIERRHFRRYLAGEVIPHNATQERIARFFKVPVAALFAGTAEENTQDVTCAAVLQRVFEGPPSINGGLYHTWFWAPVLGDTIVGALTVLRKEPDRMSFARLTSSAERGTNWSYFKGIHQGVVVDRLGLIYFQGSNRLPPKEPSLLVVERAVSAQPLYKGFGMVLTGDGPKVTNVVMARAEAKIGIKKALLMARAVKFDNSIIDDQVLSILMADKFNF